MTIQQLLEAMLNKTAIHVEGRRELQGFFQKVRITAIKMRNDLIWIELMPAHGNSGYNQILFTVKYGDVVFR